MVKKSPHKRVVCKDDEAVIPPWFNWKFPILISTIRGGTRALKTDLHDTGLNPFHQPELLFSVQVTLLVLSLCRSLFNQFDCHYHN